MGLGLQGRRAGRHDLTFEGGKVLSGGRLTYDPASKTYRLEGTDPQRRSRSPSTARSTRRPASWRSTASGRRPRGEERLTIRPNAERDPLRLLVRPQGARLSAVRPGDPGQPRQGGGELRRGRVNEQGAAVHRHRRRRRDHASRPAARPSPSAAPAAATRCWPTPRSTSPSSRPAMTSAGGDAGGNTIRTGPGDGSFDSPSGATPPRPAMKKDDAPARRGARPRTGARRRVRRRRRPQARPHTGPRRRPGCPPQGRLAAAARPGAGEAGKADGALGFYRACHRRVPRDPRGRDGQGADQGPRGTTELCRKGGSDSGFLMLIPDRRQAAGERRRFGD